MRRKLLAVSALTGVMVLPAEAAMFKVDENTFASFGAKFQIRGAYLGDKSDPPNPDDVPDFQFLVPNARIYFSGQVHKYVYFGSNFDFTVKAGGARASDAFVGLRVGDLLGAKGFLNLQAGVYRVPVSRLYLTDSYSYIAPTGYTYRLDPDVVSPLERVEGMAGFRHGGVTLWGIIGDGVIKYYLGMFDVNDRDADQGERDPMYTARLQFTPTMLGYKPEKAYTAADTHLGKQNVLAIGIGYASQAIEENPTTHERTVDVFWEQKFGSIVPNIMFAYKDMDNFGGAAQKDGSAYVAQGQLLFDQAMGIGKPAIAVRFIKSNPDWDNDTDVLGVYFNYYIKGQDAKIAFGADAVDPQGGQSYTDWTLFFQTQF